MANMLSVVTVTTPAAPKAEQGQPVTDASLQQMANVLESLLSHTHVFFDDYGTACNCNCNCQCDCTRGSF